MMVKNFERGGPYSHASNQSARSSSFGTESACDGPDEQSHRRSGSISPVIITLLVLLGVGLLLSLWLMGIYNGLVVAWNRFENAFAQIDVQLKRRYELIPN